MNVFKLLMPNDAKEVKQATGADNTALSVAEGAEALEEPPAFLITIKMTFLGLFLHTVEFYEKVLPIILKTLLFILILILKTLLFIVILGCAIVVVLLKNCFDISAMREILINVLLICAVYGCVLCYLVWDGNPGTSSLKTFRPMVDQPSAYHGRR